MGLYHDFCYSPVPPQKSFRMILARASVLTAPYRSPSIPLGNSRAFVYSYAFMAVRNVYRTVVSRRVSTSLVALAYVTTRLTKKPPQARNFRPKSCAPAHQTYPQRRL